MNKSYVDFIKRCCIADICGLPWDDWNKFSEEEKKQFQDELQAIAAKYKAIANKREEEKNE